MRTQDFANGAYTPQAESGGTPATSTSVPLTITPVFPTNAPGGIVRLLASTTCFVAVGPTPTAANTDVCLAANVPEFIYVPAGQKLSALAQTTAGTINWAVLQ